jgi:hypothetical protein
MKAKELASLLQRKTIRVESKLEAGADSQAIVTLGRGLSVTIWGDEDFTLNRESLPGVVQPLGGFNTVEDLARAILKN